MAIFRKIKQKIKTIAGKKIKAKPKAKITNRKTDKLIPVREKGFSGEEKKEIIGAQEMFVEKTKFYTSSRPKVTRAMPQDLPHEYGEDKIILQVRDPWWMHSYWEVTLNTWNRLKEQLKEFFYKAKKVLRVYDVSNIIFDGKNAHGYFDIDVGVETNNWYINAGGPGRAWCVDLGLKLPNGKFVTIVRSNTVHAPLDGPSWITDEEWMIPEEMFARLYGMGFGFGQSSPIGKAWQERVKRALFSGALASPGMASMASPVKKVPKERKFWFVLDCELIVYGATEPDAKVYVQGKQIKLRPDGTFTLRYALPDGKQVIPVKAVSSDEIEERTITPTVTRDTKSSCLVKEKVIA